jgi:hypothetical protein
MEPARPVEVNHDGRKDRNRENAADAVEANSRRVTVAPGPDAIPVKGAVKVGKVKGT